MCVVILYISLGFNMFWIMDGYIFVVKLLYFKVKNFNK